MKVAIAWDPDTRQWCFGTWARNGDALTKSGPFASYPQAIRGALAAAHEIDNAGWKHKLLQWNWNMHSIEKFPEWVIEKEGCPAFVKLSHVRGSGDVESSALAIAWDDTAQVDFYQRDWTEDGIPFVNAGDTYWSGWWFATIAERDRFIEWRRARGEDPTR